MPGFDLGRAGANPAAAAISISRAVFPTADCKSAVSKRVGEGDERSVTSTSYQVQMRSKLQQTGIRLLPGHGGVATTPERTNF